MAWAYGWKNLIVPGPPAFPAAGMPFDMARNVGCQVALERGCEYVFHHDSDLILPHDTILRLIARKKPVISGVYYRRSPPAGVPVMQRKFQWVTEFPPNKVLEDIDWVGAGCLLIHRSVLEAMKPPSDCPWKRWFRWRVDEQGMVPHGVACSEDFSFDNRCKQELGIPICVDTAVCATRHVGYAQATYGRLDPLETNPVT
jgi:hypothetical protein